MKEYEELYEKWRNLLFHTNVCMSIFAFVFEVLMCFVIYKAKLMSQPLSQLLLGFLIIPTVFIGLAIIIGYFALKMSTPSMKFINYIPAVQMSIICMVIACTYSFFPATQCIFCIPIFTTIIFNDKTMTKRITFINCIFLVFAFISRKYLSSITGIDVNWEAESAVSFSFIMLVNIICDILINYQEEKDIIIVRGYVQEIKMHDMLNKDQKTGLYGNTALLNMLQNMTATDEVDNTPFALAIIDVDDFKKVNDTYGHAIGDKIIIALAELMKKNCCDNHLPARFGGEEFAIILNEEEKNCSYDFVDQLRKEFAEITTGIIGQTVTISCGIAKWTPSLTSEELFNNADSAMYLSKTTGKNKTTIFEN